MNSWKQDIGEKALQLGIIKDPQWLDRMDDPMPLWAVLEIAIELLNKLDPPSISYD